MSREFKPEVTEGMQKATWYIAPEPTETEVFRAMTAHPDFQRQLRAWAAEEMRGLVPSVEKPVTHGGTEECKADAFNACRAETLANITAWENKDD